MPSFTINFLKQLSLSSPTSITYEMALAYFFARAALLEEEEKKHRLSQRRRLLRERFTMNSIPDKEFVYKYRLSRELFNKLCEELTPLLPAKQRRHGLDPSMKILAVLNFFGWGRLQHSTGKNFNLLANQTMSRCIREVTMALNHSSIIRKYMKFPQNKNDRDVIKKKFFEKFGFPDVVGCIDCTHIAIIKPVTNEGNYLNEKDYYSLFAQIICDADCYIQNVDASFGGGFYNTEIWSAHPINAHLDDLQEIAYILGNTSYILEDHLMTPICSYDDDIVIENSPESRYNEIHQATHATIVETIYKLKSRWRCLLACKELHYNHEMAGRILIACCILHNMCNMAGLEAPEMSERDIEEERKRQSEVSNSSLDDRTEERAKLVQRIEENRLKSCGNTMEATVCLKKD